MPAGRYIIAAGLLPVAIYLSIIITVYINVGSRKISALNSLAVPIMLAVRPLPL